MRESSGQVWLTTGETSLVLDCSIGGRPGVLYWGKALLEPEPDLLVDMATRQHAPGSADHEVRGSLLNEAGSGGLAPPGFAAHRSCLDWANLFRVVHVEQPTPLSVEITCRDTASKIAVMHRIELHPTSELATFETMITNEGDAPLFIDQCAAVCLPLDPRATRLRGFTGRWADEFQLEDVAPHIGSYVRENRAGRTSHDTFPGLLAATEHTTERAGLCFAFHLGWSGNNRTRVDRLADGRAFLQMGECFWPGESSLEPGGTYRTPVLYAGYSDQGYSKLSQRFHRHLKTDVMDQRISRKPRPVHYNTWEAVYFDHDPAKLIALATKAAKVGAERFILDDGWFGSRRHDKAGLGDWHVSSDIYPDGLDPLIKHVTDLGMEFGLWFEPEMVNPDSDLYRAHPDWVLQVEGIDTVAFRNQLPLDLTQDKVFAYLFERMHKLLSDHDISYIKWDMNRDIHHPGRAGRAVSHQQTQAVYRLIDHIRKHHPDLEIESCASGGGRADYGVLSRTDRIWTSDTNDALDRQIIQRGASHFFPLEIMGAHVGPRTCHITGRRLSMNLRVATAFFGHMGMELNLLEERETDLEILKAGIALHKKYRSLIHSGDMLRLDTPEHVNAIGTVAPDRSEALFSWCNLTGHRETLPGRIYFPGLDNAAHYRLRIVWPDPVRSISKPSVLDAMALDGEGRVIPGKMLREVGLQLPLLHPETCLIFHLKAVE
ncbi:MAG: alpha-galactosidase [Pseudomonadota bacterium]